MDRNQFIGLVLMLVLITVYFQFFAPEPPPAPEEIDNIPQPVDTTTVTPQESNTRESTSQTLSDSALSELNNLRYGVFSPLAAGEERQMVLENEQIKVTFSTKGGSIDMVELKDFIKYDSSELILVDDKHSIDLFFEHLSKRINIRDLYFDGQIRNNGDSTEAIFSFAVNGKRFSQIYTLPKSGYQLGYRLKTSGFEKQIDPKNLSLVWTAGLAKLEADLRDARNRTSVHYRLVNEESDYLSRTSTSHEEETLLDPVRWLSFNQKFFTSSIIATKAFESAFISLDPSNSDEIIKNAMMQAEIPFTDFAANEATFKFYFGPNDYNILKGVSDGFADNVELGWFFLPWINKYLVIPIWNFLELFIPNYGLIIIILVLVIRLILSPLTYSSHISMAKMRVLKPELDAIKERVGGDTQKAQTEQMDLYRKAGINPISGCIPVLLQFPILVSLFYFIPAAIELRMVPFLWADDLSTYDNILNLPFNIPFYGSHVSLFTLLMAGSTVLYTLANAQVTTVQGPMKTLQYVMPVMLLFFFNSYPSGLSYYYFVSNIVSFGQIALFRKFIDEDKIKRLMEENKKKNANKKKSKFQMRLEEAMKANQEAQKKKKKK